MNFSVFNPRNPWVVYAAVPEARRLPVTNKVRQSLLIMHALEWA